MENADLIEEVLTNKIEIPVGERIESEPVKKTLTLRQEQFCRLYAFDEKCMGNGAQTYLEVYNIDKSKPGWYRTACVAASMMLDNPKIYGRINKLLEEGGMNDQFIDKQLLFLISQQSDFTNKMSAIKEYNKLKQRITDRIEHSGNIAIGSILAEIQGNKIDKVN